MEVGGPLPKLIHFFGQEAKLFPRGAPTFPQPLPNMAQNLFVVSLCLYSLFFWDSSDRRKGGGFHCGGTPKKTAAVMATTKPIIGAIKSHGDEMDETMAKLEIFLGIGGQRKVRRGNFFKNVQPF
jgi:hypothetical protein